MLSRGRVLLVVLACAMFCACGDKPPEETRVKSSQGKPSKGPDGLPAEMVAAVPAGKGEPVISVHFALHATPTVGKPLPVDIAILAHQKFASVRAHFEAQDGVVVASGKEVEPVLDVANQKVLSHQLILQPNRDGVFMVTAAVETESDEGTITRIFSIPVIVHAAT